MADDAALSYHEPGITTILLLISFLILSNALNSVFDRLLFCGLISQILLGIAFGTPGAAWLSPELETAITQLGYIGLILIVYEGGLATNVSTLYSNLALSSVVATIGVSAPIALSFLLVTFFPITKLQAFAAGAALCSTSLGTTFTILSTSQLSQSRLGVVLSSAAMMDDVVGLVMSGIISSLGRAAEFNAITVVRPVLVSIAFGALIPFGAWAIVRPLTRTIVRKLPVREQMFGEGVALSVDCIVLMGCIVGASYAGTSVLLAAYLAGATLTWWDGCVTRLWSEHLAQTQSRTSAADQQAVSSASKSINTSRIREQIDVAIAGPASSVSIVPLAASVTGNSFKLSAQTNPTAAAVFGKHLRPALSTILQPFFFASIGFAIPVSKMFAGHVVWRGIVYALLMAFAKLLCGLCLVRVGQVTTVPPDRNTGLKGSARRLKRSAIMSWRWVASWRSCFRFTRDPAKRPKSEIARLVSQQRRATEHTEREPEIQASATAATMPVEAPSRTIQSTSQQHTTTSTLDDNQSTISASQTGPTSRETDQAKPARLKPLSLYPAALLGSAMVARGEIGFLISAVAESQGVFAGRAVQGGQREGRAGVPLQASELFLVVTWAILLCTLIGPVVVGLLVRRVRKLQVTERERQTGREDPLGEWGLSGADTPGSEHVQIESTGNTGPRATS